MLLSVVIYYKRSSLFLDGDELHLVECRACLVGPAVKELKVIAKVGLFTH